MSANIHMRILGCLAGLMLVVSGAYSQETDSSHVPKLKKNTVSIVMRNHYFFDGNPLLSRSAYGQWLLTCGWGLEYTHRFNGRHGVLASAGFMGKTYPPPQWEGSASSLPPSYGIVYSRLVSLLELDYVRTLLITRHFLVSGYGGLNLRQGEESIIGRYWYGQDNLGGDGYRLRDLGVVVGSRVEVLLPLNLQISGDVRFVEYVYRSDRTRYPEYPNYAGKGATRHMLSAQMGFGYQF